MRKPEVLELAASLSRKRDVSLNSLIQEGRTRGQEDGELFEAFEELGSLTVVCNVEYAIHAQAEVMLHD